ncbi:Serine/Threonine protein kinase [Pseudooceanicola batsensis HTCC2597]|uniref:Serine/Threonine protein kinase n=1 Tax=Pseudooceanicola batsensis (strain ATCC BAA-863 / DSM 15984 / KCTC 12145 / HTCC2597) TaxID=252305 RepID=A3TYD2_PSEBH|nr:serine/threonine protein kinase [Pseudooceanicola batsensis]EAQ03166.1 Serine/Threonine protein kinase [Pseudooceanicola batsensis HTCC2597]
MAQSQAGDIFRPGDLLNNTYRIEAILGRGGTSEVYKARSEISGRVMAIKALRAEFASNEDFLALMTREEDIRDVRHDAIVRYFDTQRMADGVVYLVMDYVDGPGLDRKLADGGMSAGELMVIGERVTEGLIAAHGRNIVHRDLSPDNIILRNDTPSEAVIIDFGIAKDTNPGAETIVGNEFAGKYAYAAPEQLSGRTDHRSDIYSLGALLLSTFRGKKPDTGKNPMEVVENKQKPLDLDGVPDPLRKIIAKMTHPDPDQRFATAQDLLAAFRDPSLVEAAGVVTVQDDILDDATVIAAPPARREAAEAAEEAVGIPSDTPDPRPQDKARRSRGLFVPIVALIVVAGLGAVAWMGGLLDGIVGPRYPVADPYSLIIEDSFGSDPQAVGYVPSPEVGAEVSGLMEGIGGTSELTLATGDIAETWGTGIVEVLRQAVELEEFRLVADGNQVKLSGLAPGRATKSAIESALADGFPEGLNGSLDLQLGPRLLEPGTIEPLLSQYADCGQLRLVAPPPLGYGLEDQVIVTGRFADEASRRGLQSAITAQAGDRAVRVEGEILNEALCQVDAVLPGAGPGGFDLRMGFGDQEGENVSGRYTVGDNPVLDVRIPADVTDGYLYVTVIDVKGDVFHLLPNRIRPENSIEALRAEAENGWVRLAYALDEAQGTGRIAFTVDDSVLGKSKIVVLHSEQPLFDELRPTTESAAGYAEALAQLREDGALSVTSMDTAILTTER